MEKIVNDIFKKNYQKIEKNNTNRISIMYKKHFIYFQFKNFKFHYTIAYI